MNHVGTVLLETERLRLRRLTMNDMAQMYRNWACDDEVTRFLSWSSHADMETTRRYLWRVERSYDDPRVYEWGVERKADSRLIGTIGGVNVNDELESVGLGWMLSRAVWGQGYMPEAAQKVLELFFLQVGMARVSAVHHPDNRKSGRVMEKIGMTYEGTLRAAARDNRGRLIDVCVYSVLREEFLRRVGGSAVR